MIQSSVPIFVNAFWQREVLWVHFSWYRYTFLLKTLLRALHENFGKIKVWVSLNLLIQNEDKFPFLTVYNTVTIIWWLYYYTFLYKCQFWIEICEISSNKSWKYYYLYFLLRSCGVKQWKTKLRSQIWNKILMQLLQLMLELLKLFSCSTWDRYLSTLQSINFNFLNLCCGDKIIDISIQLYSYIVLR